MKKAVRTVVWPTLLYSIGQTNYLLKKKHRSMKRAARTAAWPTMLYCVGRILIFLKTNTLFTVAIGLLPQRLA